MKHLKIETPYQGLGLVEDDMMMVMTMMRRSRRRMMIMIMFFYTIRANDAEL